MIYSAVNVCNSYHFENPLSKAGFVFDDKQITEKQPFPCGVLGCNQFRIPGIIRLKNGHLFAVSDARWSFADKDAGGIDTIFAVSDDNGATWRQGFAAYFPDSAGTPDDFYDATTCIDPDVIQSADGVIHIYVNMNPTGYTTALTFPLCGNGFLRINGKDRLCVVRDYEDASVLPDKLPKEKIYYIGDYKNGIADILSFDGKTTGYSTDEYFNIYNEDILLTQKQVNSDKIIGQNLFYRDSCFHVYNTMYTMHLTSSDEGRTWRNEIISDKIKNNTDFALISSPGNAAMTDDGTLLLPFYRCSANGDSESCIVFSKDNGISYNRTSGLPKTDTLKWSGENKIVVLSNKLWRVFFRNGISQICYADYYADTNTWAEPVIISGIKVHSDCNFSAIRFNGKILISYCAGQGPQAEHRLNGTLYEFKVNDDADNSMTLLKQTLFAESAFSYSDLTHINKNQVGVLWDTCGDGYVLFDILSV